MRGWDAVDYEAAAENARAARMRALDEALRAVRLEDADVLSADEKDALDAAQRAVASLRQTW
jgi:hypothetical protein